MQSRPRSTASALVLTAVATLVTPAGCAAAASAPRAAGGAPGGSVAIDPSAAALVPQTFKTKGTISFGTDPTHAPDEFTDDAGALKGFDIDLGNAVAAKLGLQAKFTVSQSDTILAGITSGDFDAGLSSFADRKAREGQGFELVDYLNVGTGLMVAKGNPQHLGPDDLSLCGKTVGVQDGAVQQDPDLKADRPAKCKAGGKPDPITLTGQTQADVNNLLQSGRADAVLADDVAVDWFAKNNGFDAIGKPYGAEHYGIVVTNDNDPLAKALLSALVSLQSDGTYDSLLAKWDITVAKYGTFGIDQATS